MVLFKITELLSVRAMCSKMADIILSKISQKEKDKYCMISFICGIYRKESPNSKEQRIDWWLPGAGK